MPKKNRNAQSKVLSKSNKQLLKTKIGKQFIDKPLPEFESLVATFSGEKRQPYVDKAIQHVRSIKSNAESAQRYLVKTQEKKVKHVFELNSKYAFAVVCLVILFIGGPMGALVRKGGFR